VFKAASLIRQEMPQDLPLIGFSGSPWTLACYMVEGKSSRDFKKTLQWMYEAPELMQELLQTLASIITQYLIGQIHAGVNALMLFDTWGGILSSDNYLRFSLNPITTIVQALKKDYPHIPVIVFTKGGGQWLSAIADTGCDALGLDWTCDLRKARELVGDRVALQGNLDPVILTTNPMTIEKEVEKVVRAYGRGYGHIFNLGHGITPDVPPENVAVMIEAVKKFSSGYR
jgi:uroporphyrinogen decarboxylase